MSNPTKFLLLMGLLMVASGCSESEPPFGECDFQGEPLIVDSLLDLEEPADGTMTIRAALNEAAPCQPIVFDESLDGGTIELSIIGEAHSVLQGEVMGMRDEPSGPVSYLEGYFDRDYGPSALYARRNVVIDASALSSGITLSWTGGTDNPARVLAVYGDLTMTNVTVTGGYSIAEAIEGDGSEAQPWTLARGGGLAVWGIARLTDCTIYDNHCVGDFDSSRDRGAFGGGLYTDIVDIERCVVSGNSVVGGGAAGGGVYSVGGAGVASQTSSIAQSVITGNRISGLFTYGGGIYSDGGGIGNLKTLLVTSSTIARNLVEPAPGLPGFMLGMGYWRGGGVYMSNGHLKLRGCTIVENEVYGVPRTDSLAKPNLAGGIAATIGNAHAVETMVIRHSIVAGNTVTELDAEGSLVATYAHDIFTGSLLHFHSRGYNLFGVVDFSQILVPVGEPDWQSLSRRHYPKEGDETGIQVADVLNLDGGITTSDTILSAGVDASNPAVLYYEPRGDASDRLPAEPYRVESVYAEYSLADGATDDFLSIVLERIEDHYELASFATDFTADFEAYLQSVDLDDETPGAQPHTNRDGNPILTLAETLWFGPSQTWPGEIWNYAYIEFWHRLDEALRAQNIPGMGPELLGDDAWSALFQTGRLAENAGIAMLVEVETVTVRRVEVDQIGTPRPEDSLGDIGAIDVR